MTFVELEAGNSHFMSKSEHLPSKIFVSVGISFNKAGTVPEGRALNAASVGANNVNGPAPERATSNPHAFTAASNVV